MEPAEIDDLLDRLESYLKTLDGKGLPNGQRSVLYGCISEPHLTYEGMASQLRTVGVGSFTPKTLKNDASQVFQRLSRSLGGEIKKKNCRRGLLNWYYSQQKSPVPPPPPPASPRTTQVAKALIHFDAWQQDLTDLATAIRRGRRILCIRGAACVGKTYLTYALIEQIQADFAAVVHCQAPDVLTPESLQQAIARQLPQEMLAGAAVPALSELLQTRSILLVIDQTEVLLQSQRLVGQFRDTCAGYEIWLKRLLELPAHAGCLIWVGQELPTCFALPHYSVLQVHQVSRLQTQDAAALLKTRNIPVEAIAGWQELVEFCGGNPAWLLMEVPLLQRSPTQDVASFLANPPLERNLVETLQRVLERLSAIERLLLFWLLLKPASYDEIRRLDIPDVLPSDLEYALTSLESRSLVRLDDRQCYRLTPSLLEYVLAEWVVREMDGELATHALKMLHQYRLFNGAASVQRQRWQQQHLLGNLARRFRNRYGFRQEQIDAISGMLAQVRQMPIQQHGGAISNLLNLAVALGLPIAPFNVSGLPLRHVDLRRADLRNANLEGCTFQHSLLPYRLTGIPTADLAPDGGAIAAGDQDGHLLYWQRQGETLRLRSFHQLPAAVDKVLFQNRSTLILVSHRDVYSWWLNGESAPEPIVELPDRASCLAHNDSSYIAIGLVNGQIILWNEISRQVRVLKAHGNEVCNLSFSPDGRFLASVGIGNRVLLWSLTSAIGESLPYQELSCGPRICLATGWHQSTLLRAEVYGSQICLRSQTTLMQERGLCEGEVVDLRFSKNGHYLAGTTDSGYVFCWDWQTQRFTSLKQSNSHPIILGICEKGRWLLLFSAGEIQLYDTHNQENFWQVGGSPFDCSHCKLQKTRGLTAAERELFRALGGEIFDG